MFMKSWAEVESVVIVVQHTEAEALALVGQPETTIEMLLESADKQALQ